LGHIDQKIIRTKTKQGACAPTTGIISEICVRCLFVRKPNENDRRDDRPVKLDAVATGAIGSGRSWAPALTSRYDDEMAGLPISRRG
jgi:hypothetical protein